MLLIFRSGVPSALARLVGLGAVMMGVALLGACTVGPDYVPDHAALPSAYNSTDALQTLRANAPPGSAGAADLDVWWRGFNDPVLTRIVDRALEQNLDLAAAEARVLQARAVAAQAGTRYLPEVALNGQAEHQRQSLESPLGRLGHGLPGYERSQTDTQIGVGASWEIDLAGGLRRQAQAATAEAEAASALHAGTRVSIAADAADAYFSIRSAQTQIAIVRSQIDNDTHLVSLIRNRVSNGVATQREVAEAQSRLAQTRALLPPMNIDIARQTNRLDILMGVAPGTFTADLAQPVSDFAIPGLPADIQPAQLLRQRPDVVAAERRLVAANAGIGAAVAGYYPSVSISALLGFEALNGPLFKADAFQPGALAGLHWRIFDFGRVDAEVAQARGRHAEALAQYRQAVLRAAEDVENALTTWAQVGVQRDEVAHQLDAETLAQRSVREAFGQGDASLVEVLIEDRQLLIARTEMARLKAEQARAAVATFRALGGGWAIPADAATQTAASAP